MTRVLFFVDTPLQFYNAYLLASSTYSTYRPSLVVYAQFSNAQSITAIYKKTGLFENVYTIKPKRSISYKQNFLWQLSAIGGHFSLNLSCIAKEKYDIFALACPTPATMEVFLTLKKCNPFLKVAFYEDGTGTYNGNVFKQPFYFEKAPAENLDSINYINLIRKFTSVSKKAPWSYQPSAIYVKRPSLLTYQPNIPCRRIIPNINAVERLSSLLLDPNVPPFQNAKFLVFDVPRGKTESFGASTIDIILDECTNNTSKRDCYLREHPRSSERSTFATNCVDFSKGLWELMCQNSHISNCLLVGVASTAQLAPYIETGEKPPLLLLHQIAFKKNDQHYLLGEQVVNLIKTAYGLDFNNKVHVPSTLNEALNIIERFL